MSILVNQDTKVIVQGLGKQGAFHARLMKKYGTQVVAAVSTSQRGQFNSLPVYPTIRKAAQKHRADFSILFIPAPFVKKAALGALENHLNLVIISEGVPVHDTLEILQKAKEKKLMVIGPNCPGIISPGESKIGIMPSEIFQKGRVGIISRSGTLTYEIVSQLTRKGLGQSTVIGIGGDLVIGLNFVQALKLFKKDRQTKAIVLIGEIGGNLEEKAADYIQKHFNKPVVAYIAGRTAPKEKALGHAGALIEGNTGTATAKIKALLDAGVKIAPLPSQVAPILQGYL